MSQDNLVQFEDYVGAAKRQRRVIGLAVAACVVLAILATLVTPKTYTAESRVLVRPIVDPSDRSSSEVNIDTERGVARSLSVARIAAGMIGEDEDASALQQNLSVEPVTDSQILVFSYSSGSPDEAFGAAGAFADAYLQFRSQEADRATKQVRASLETERDDLIARRAGLQEQIRGLAPDSSERVELESELAVVESNENDVKFRLTELNTAQVDAGTVIDEAEKPTAPSSPSLKLNLAAGLLIGAIIGLLLAFLKERQNLGGIAATATDRSGGTAAEIIGAATAVAAPSTAETPVVNGTPPVSAPTPTPSPTPASAPVSDPADRRSSRPIETVLRDAGVSSLGMVPRLTNDADAPPFDSVTMLNGHVGDRLRALDDVVSAHLQQSGQRIIMVTTPEHRGIAVGLAGSLAVTAAQTGREVLLLGGDLEQPTLHSRFQLANDQGLAEALRGQRPLAQVMQGWGGYETLVVVTAGQADPGGDRLDEHVLRTRLAPLRDDFQLVLIEAPPVLASPDALTLASVCDGAILAIDPRRSEPERIAQAAHELQQRTQILGSVMVEARARRDAQPASPGGQAVVSGHHP